MTTQEEPAMGSPVGAIIVSFLLAIGGAGAAAVVYIAASIYMRAHHAGFWAVMAATLVFTLTVVAIALGSAQLGRRMMKQELCAQSAPNRRYVWRFSVAMSLYAVVLVATIGVYIRVHPTGVLAYGLAVTPALPLIGAIVIMGLYLREETDEFQRAVLVESSLLATGGLLAVATVWGFLEMFRLVPHVPSWAAFPLWATLYGPAQLIARWRYR
jgi:hypothetical protein